MATKYINEADKYLADKFGDNKYKRFSGQRILDDMKEKEAVALDTKLTKLQKLQRITAFRSFDINWDGYEGEQRTTVGLLAIKHAIYLINGIIKFQKVSKEGSTTIYTRTCEDYTAVLIVRLDGFRLTIGKGEETLLDRKVGGVKTRHEGNWYVFYKEVDKAVDLGNWKWNYSLKGTDIFEVNYKVERKQIETIKAAMREEFVKVGLMTSARGGSGWTVGNASWGTNGRHSYDDIISIRQMYYGETIYDFKLAVETATKVLVSFGYTEAWER